MLVALIVAIIVTAAVEIVAEYRQATSVKYFFKPLTTILIITAALAATHADASYRWLIVVGLVFSLSGDVFLMLPEEPRSFFIPGLVVFLIAHLFYIVAFSLGVPWTASDLPLAIPFLIFGVGCAAYLWKHLGPMKAPVAAYIVVILVMGWRSAVRIGEPDIATAGAVLGCVGAVLFIVSDLILAINRFTKPFAAARATNLTTYWGGQLLIALSVHY